ncbi:MAG: glycosyltransferase family 9 protein [Ignavibacteria bacterium]|nr:glycosyltransferase family 9 protein [Ignavibacteria bacterium]
MALKLLKSISKKRNISAGKISPDKIKNILIVRQHNQLGDMLCSLPLFVAVRKKFSNAEITLVASPDNFEILNSPSNKYIDHIILYKKDSPKSLLSFYNKLKKRKYDIGIVPSTVSFSKTSHLINHLSGAKIRVGVSKTLTKDGHMINESDFLLDIKKEFSWDKEKIHQWQRNLSIGEEIGCRLSQEEIQNVSLNLSRSEISFAEKFYSSYFSNDDNIFIGLHIGAGKPPNRWSAKNFVELAKKLTENKKVKLLVSIGPMDYEAADDFKRQAAAQKLKMVFIENEKIRNLAAILSKLDLYITNDTGTMHVAGFVKTKLISLFGPTPGWEWAPRFANQHYLQSASGDINEISPVEVFKESQKVLKLIF